MNDKSSSVPQEDHERALAFLVNEYLKKRNFISASAAFTVEAQLSKKEDSTPELELVQGAFLSDWFQALYKLLTQNGPNNKPPSDADTKRFLESSKQLFEVHKVSSIPVTINPSSSASQPGLGLGAPGSLKSEGFSSKFGPQQGPDNSGEPPNKMMHLANGKGAPGGKFPQTTGAPNGMSLAQQQQSLYANPHQQQQIRPQFNMSLPSHSAGLIANWPGAQGIGTMPPQQSDGSAQQASMAFSLNGQMSGIPQSAAPGSNDPNHVMTALQNASPAGLKGSLPPQQFLSPQQQLMAQQQSQQQRHLLYQQNQRYLLQQQMMAGGLMNPNMAYMNPNGMVAMGANNNRMLPIYQQREVYAQHHKQVQMLKLQQHNARQQLMLTRQAGGNPGQPMGRPPNDASPHPGQQGMPMNPMTGFPGSHPGGPPPNPMMMQQMMSMGGMPNFNGVTSAPHFPNANNPQPPNGAPSAAPNTNANNNANANNANNNASNNVNFEALFASMQSSGSNVPPPGASPAASGGPADPSKSSSVEDESAKMFGKFVDSDLFNLGDTTNSHQSQGTDQSNNNNGSANNNNNNNLPGNLSGNLDLYSLDPFAQTEFFS